VKNADNRAKTASRYMVPNLERALIIIEYLLDYPDGLGLAELTAGLKFPKNSIFRIAMTLLEKGYLERDEDVKRFKVSRKFLAIGHRVLSDKPIIPLALDIMRECRDVVKESVFIGTLVENEGVVMEQVLGSHPFKFTIDPGMRFKLHVAAPGKALLAYLPEGERESLISRLNLVRFNERTITTRKGLRAELTRVRESGFALDRGEELHGIVCVGAPVFNQHGYPVAAIWTTGPEDRIDETSYSKMGNIIRAHADRISQRLGCELPRA
jgi:DNA-binding IclR family transcriptional regulator